MTINYEVIDRSSLVSKKYRLIKRMVASTRLEVHTVTRIKVRNYNRKRIKQKLKGLSPIEYRNQAVMPT
ncbi:IS3 family transposase [Thiomicrorhabdus indica]|uniref:IS3 family transposase n=1 Tax=Thiomicrorhabdus indica TaxID=2267253 RepID=UPI003983EA4C